MRGLLQSPPRLVLLADLELATSTISLPAQSTLFTQGEDARCLYLICGGYLKLTVGDFRERQMIVRVAGPGSMLGLYAVLSHGVYEVSAETLTTAQLRPVERDRFLGWSWPRRLVSNWTRAASAFRCC